MKKQLTLPIILVGAIIALILTSVMEYFYTPFGAEYFESGLKLIYIFSPLIAWFLFCTVYDIGIDYFNNKPQRSVKKG